MDESVVRVFEEQKVGVLKFSDAIRIGSKIRPQCRGTFFDGSRSCALGAAVEAKLGTPTVSFPCNWPEFFGAPQEITSKVIHLNDHQGWSRERIADWVEAQGY